MVFSTLVNYLFRKCVVCHVSDAAIILFLEWPCMSDRGRGKFMTSKQYIVRVGPSRGIANMHMCEVHITDKFFSPIHSQRERERRGVRWGEGSIRTWGNFFKP